MTKRRKKGLETKTLTWILAAVGLVAVAGIVGMFLGQGVTGQWLIKPQYEKRWTVEPTQSVQEATQQSGCIPRAKVQEIVTMQQAWQKAYDDWARSLGII